MSRVTRTMILLAAVFAVSIAPHLASAQSCTGANGLSCTCTPAGNCSGGIEASKIYTKGTVQPVFAGVTCGSNEACLAKGDALCARVLQAYAQGTQSSCKSSCSNPGLKATLLLSMPSDPCSTGVCCAEAAGSGSASAGGCINLPGVTSACKSKAASGDVDFSRDTYWSSMLSGSCPNAVCTAPAGSELCAAVAKHENLSGTYVCAQNSSDCQTVLNNAVGASLCGSQGTCCIAKAGAATTNANKAGGAGTPKTLPDPLGGVNIPTFFGNVIKTFAGIAGTIALCMFIYGGIMLILSGGEQKKVADGKKILINASIGLILIFSAYTFVTAIISAILAE